MAELTVQRYVVCVTHIRFGAIVEGDTIRSGWRCDLDDTRTDFGAICKDYEEAANEDRADRR